MTHYKFAFRGASCRGCAALRATTAEVGPIRRRGQRGQIILLVAVTIPMLLGFAGLAVDAGLLWTTKRHMQTATDAAAIAAATSFRNNGSYASAGSDLASLNGFTHGSNGVAVTVNSPPVKGAYASVTNYVEVIISQPMPLYFMRILGLSSALVSTRAVAISASSDYCITTLDPSASGAFSNDNAVSATCGIMVNSDLSQIACKAAVKPARPVIRRQCRGSVV